MQKFILKIKRDLKNSKKIRDSFYFLIYFLISFIFIYLLLSKTKLYYLINYFYGSLSSNLLNIFYNVPSSFYYDFIEKTTFIFVPALDYPIAIVFLCTGILEFSLIFSAIISSFNVSLKKRLFWIFLSSLIVIIFNLLRITFTIFIILSLDLSVANFFHGFLFRIFLVLIVVGIYYYFLKLE